MNKVKMNETEFIANFNRDASFRINFFYQIDRCLQQFLSICFNVSDVEYINFDLIDISHIHLSVMRQQFFCTPPRSFSRHKRKNYHSQHGTNAKPKKRRSRGHQKRTLKHRFGNLEITRPTKKS